jgi:hypothetical protein
LPFTRLPKIMITHMVDDVVRCLNMFPRAHTWGHRSYPYG